MSEPRTAAATARRRADSDHKRQRVLTVAGALIDRGQDFSWEQLARAAQVNPGFVHRAPGLKAEIEALRDNATVELEAGLRSGTALTIASVKAENTFLKRRLHEREHDVATLKRRLGEALGQTMLDRHASSRPGSQRAGRRARAAAIRGQRGAARTRRAAPSGPHAQPATAQGAQPAGRTMTDTSWPAPPAEAVFHGPAGEFVLRTEPHTESHPMALLSQFLVAFGTATGAGAYYAVEASRHHSNEFVVLVGPQLEGAEGFELGSRRGADPRRRRAVRRAVHRLGDELGRGADRRGRRRRRGRRAARSAS